MGLINGFCVFDKKYDKETKNFFTIDFKIHDVREEMPPEFHYLTDQNRVINIFEYAEIDSRNIKNIGTAYLIYKIEEKSSENTYQFFLQKTEPVSGRCLKIDNTYYKLSKIRSINPSRSIYFLYNIHYVRIESEEKGKPVICDFFKCCFNYGLDTETLGLVKYFIDTNSFQHQKVFNFTFSSHDGKIIYGYNIYIYENDRVKSVVILSSIFSSDWIFILAIFENRSCLYHVLLSLAHVKIPDCEILELIIARHSCSGTDNRIEDIYSDCNKFSGSIFSEKTNHLNSDAFENGSVKAVVDTKFEGSQHKKKAALYDKKFGEPKNYPPFTDSNGFIPMKSEYLLKQKRAITAPRISITVTKAEKTLPTNKTESSHKNINPDPLFRYLLCGCRVRDYNQKKLIKFLTKTTIIKKGTTKYAHVNASNNLGPDNDFFESKSVDSIPADFNKIHDFSGNTASDSQRLKIKDFTEKIINSTLISGCRNLSPDKTLQRVFYGKSPSKFRRNSNYIQFNEATRSSMYEYTSVKSLPGFVSNLSISDIYENIDNIHARIRFNIVKFRRNSDISSNFSYDFILKVVQIVIAEKQIVFLSSDTNFLHACIEFFTSLIYPFEWHGLLHTPLKDKFFSFLDSPFPYIIGMKATQNNLKYLKRIKGLTIINIDKNVIKINSSGAFQRLDFFRRTARIEKSKNEPSLNISQFYDDEYLGMNIRLIFSQVFGKLSLALLNAKTEILTKGLQKNGNINEISLFSDHHFEVFDHISQQLIRNFTKSSIFKRFISKNSKFIIDKMTYVCSEKALYTFFQSGRTKGMGKNYDPGFNDYSLACVNNNEFSEGIQINRNRGIYNLEDPLNPYLALENNLNSDAPYETNTNDRFTNLSLGFKSLQNLKSLQNTKYSSIKKFLKKSMTEPDLKATFEPKFSRSHSCPNLGTYILNRKHVLTSAFKSHPAKILEQTNMVVEYHNPAGNENMRFPQIEGQKITAIKPKIQSQDRLNKINPFYLQNTAALLIDSLRDEISKKFHNFSELLFCKYCNNLSCICSPSQTSLFIQNSQFGKHKIEKIQKSNIINNLDKNCNHDCKSDEVTDNHGNKNGSSVDNLMYNKSNVKMNLPRHHEATNRIFCYLMSREKPKNLNSHSQSSRLSDSLYTDDRKAELYKTSLKSIKKTGYLKEKTKDTKIVKGLFSYKMLRRLKGCELHKMSSILALYYGIKQSTKSIRLLINRLEKITADTTFVCGEIQKSCGFDLDLTFFAFMKLDVYEIVISEIDYFNILGKCDSDFNGSQYNFFIVRQDDEFLSVELLDFDHLYIFLQILNLKKISKEHLLSEFPIQFWNICLYFLICELPINLVYKEKKPQNMKYDIVISDFQFKSFLSEPLLTVVKNLDQYIPRL